MSYSWQNKVVVITGAASGIGEQVVRLLFNENIKHVAVLDVAEPAGLTLQNELNSKHGANRVKFYKCDVTKDEQLIGAFDSVRKEHGYIDVLINNAGIMNDSPEVYKKEIEINVTSLITGTLKAMEWMRKDKGGKGGAVINISSIAGISKEPHMPIYWATKTAVIQFSNCIGHSELYEKTGVRVFSICFGATDTALISKQKLGSFDPEMNDNLRENLLTFPLQRIDSAAQGLIDSFKAAESTSIWIVAKNNPPIDVSSKFNAMYDNLCDLVKG